MFALYTDLYFCKVSRIETKRYVYALYGFQEWELRDGGNLGKTTDSSVQLFRIFVHGAASPACKKNKLLHPIL